MLMWWSSNASQIDVPGGACSSAPAGQYSGWPHDHWDLRDCDSKPSPVRGHWCAAGEVARRESSHLGLSVRWIIRCGANGCRRFGASTRPWSNVGPLAPTILARQRQPRIFPVRAACREEGPSGRPAIPKPRRTLLEDFVALRRTFDTNSLRRVRN